MSYAATVFAESKQCIRGNDEAFVRKLANDYGLFITGGTDYHGANKPDLDIGTGEGNLRVPVMLLENLK